MEAADWKKGFLVLRTVAERLESWTCRPFLAALSSATRLFVFVLNNLKTMISAAFGFYTFAVNVKGVLNMRGEHDVCVYALFHFEGACVFVIRLSGNCLTHTFTHSTLFSFIFSVGAKQKAKCKACWIGRTLTSVLTDSRIKSKPSGFNIKGILHRFSI